MPLLRHLAILFAFLAAFARPTPASAFTPASPGTRVGGFEVAAHLLVGELGPASREQHQGIGAAYDENASGYRFAAGGATRAPGTAIQTYWPPNRGFAGTPSSTTLGVGTRIDRYGSELGTFAAPQGTPFGMRSLPAEAASAPLRGYEVLRPLPAQSGASAPWFGQLGGGTQYEFTQSIESLVQQGFLRRLP